MNVEVTVKYAAGHSISFTYDETDLFCPNCGKQNVWVESGEGDYYQGPAHYCISCEWYFTMPGIGTPGEAGLQIVAQIRAARLPPPQAPILEK